MSHYSKNNTMNEISVKDIVLNLIKDSLAGDMQAVTIVSLSAALILLFLIMLVVAFRPQNKEQEPQPASQPDSEHQSQQSENTVSAQTEDGQSSSLEGDLDEFMIFRRSEKATAARQNDTAIFSEALSIEDHLRLIEKEMIKLRDLFNQGHVSRDVYVDETRNLYHQAKELSRTEP